MHWLRLRWPGGQDSGTIHLNRRTSTRNLGGSSTVDQYPFLAPIEEIGLAMFRGPRCNPAPDLIREGVVGDAITQRMAWPVRGDTPEEICVRVTAKTPTTRSGYTLAISANPPF